ncbi:MAG: riboflavin synthase [Gammaproteobacteria bacterium]
MFTGIIEAVGTIKLVDAKGSDKRFTIETGKLDLSDVSIGDSICVNGVCLTVVEMNGTGFTADVSKETLSCTTFDTLRKGDRVNLEKALRPSDRLSGHIVSGHVDGIAGIIDFQEQARSIQYRIHKPDTLSRYICRKGSICIDGVSLTINEADQSSFTVNIIPHTYEETIFSAYRKGTEINLEVDMIARYLEGLLQTEHE